MFIIILERKRESAASATGPDGAASLTSIGDGPTLKWVSSLSVNELHFIHTPKRNNIISRVCWC